MNIPEAKAALDAIRRAKPPCLMTTEGLERVIAMLRQGWYQPSEAQALALLSIAHSLVRLTDLYEDRR